VSSESKELSTPTPVNIPKVDEESFQLVSQSTPQESTLPSESEKVSTSDVVNAPDINGSKKAMLNSKEADEEPFWLWGEVISVDPYKKELLIKYLDYETDEEKTILITVDNKTTYENIKSLDEIELHSEISVDYIISQDGKNIAKNIRIESVRDVRVDYKNSKDIIPLEISDLSIVGIIFDKRNPTVIIDNKKTKELKVFKEGDYILEKIKIEEIEKDKILLNNDGRKVELFLNP
jgi:hypothetical protein